MTYKKPLKPALDYDGKVLIGYKYQIDIQNKLLKKIKSSLPDHLSCHALFCVISGKKVLLYTDAAVWSSQLRFYHHTILQELSTSNQGRIEELQIKIIPTAMKQEERDMKKLPSKESVENILSLAETQTDEKLKEALLKLGKTFRKLS